MVAYQFGRYDVNSANTNRIVRFLVQPYTPYTDANAALFGMLKGRAPAYYYYGEFTTAPTANNNLAQLRTSLVVRALSVYAPVVGVSLAADSVPTAGATANFGPALMIAFETQQNGVFYNNSWGTNTTLAEAITTDISDTVGVGGASSVKTKAGLNTLLASLHTVSYDGGTTGPFGTLSSSGAIVLPDGTTTSGAPVLSSVVGTNASGLQITFVAW